MQVLRFALRNLWRDLKSGELSVLLLALCVAVLSLTAVGFFTNRISQGVQGAGRGSARRRSAARVAHAVPRRAISRRRELSGLASAQILTFPTAIFNGEVSQLAALNAVTARYPLRGHVRIADTPFGTARTTESIPGRGEAWVDARIMAQLDIRTGGSIRIGAASFKVTQVLDYRPDQGTGFVNLAPAVLSELRRRRRDPADSAGQPRDLRGAVRGRAGGDRRISRLSAGAQGGRRAAA